MCYATVEHIVKIKVLKKVPRNLKYYPKNVQNVMVGVFTYLRYVKVVMEKGSWFRNVIDVMPLDGGQLLRIILEAIFGAKGFRYSLIIGMAIAGGGSVFFFLYHQYLIGALFFLFAFQVGKHSYFFDDRGGQILRFVYDKDDICIV